MQRVSVWGHVPRSGHAAAGHGAIGPTQTALAGEAQAPRRLSGTGAGCQGSHRLPAWLFLALIHPATAFHSKENGLHFFLIVGVH